MHRLLCFLFLATAVMAAEPPNVVIILADDLGYGDLGCYGHPKFKTPRIDQMAAEGARLTQFNTPRAVLCADARFADDGALSLPLWHVAKPCA